MKVLQPVILLVDDSRLARASVEQVLLKKGYSNILEANSAKEAFEILNIGESFSDTKQAPKIDLVLMDIVMPDMDGIKACRLIKGHEHLKDVPVIMVTAQTQPEFLGKAFEAGVMDYITKPVTPIDLIVRVKSALTLKAEIDQRKAREQELIALTAKLSLANEKLELLSSLDGLTKIANRRTFDHTLTKEWRRSNRDRRALSLIMLDIDYFKSYNDMYGHAQGDQCLKRVAQALQKRIRRTGDLLARYGGEEFAVILPTSNKGGALTLAEDLRRSVENLALPHEGSTCSSVVTISLGVSHLHPFEYGDPTQLIEAADKSLYKAKETGRNKVGFIGELAA